MLTLIKKHDFDLVFDSQKMFRCLLDAMSHPGRRIDVSEYADKLFGECPDFLAVAMTLLDNEVSFHVCGNSFLAAEIASLTLAHNENVEAADFVFISDASCARAVIEKAKTGTLLDPHKSATLVIRNDKDNNCRIKMSGPGIDGSTEMLVSQTVKTAMLLRKAQCYEYPQGIDLLFITSAGECLAIPRLVHMEVV